MQSMSSSMRSHHAMMGRRSLRGRSVASRVRASEAGSLALSQKEHAASFLRKTMQQIILNIAHCTSHNMHVDIAGKFASNYFWTQSIAHQNE